MANGDDVWGAIDKLRNDMVDVKTKGCAHHQDLMKTIEDLRNDMKWLIRIGVGILISVIITFVDKAVH